MFLGVQDSSINDSVTQWVSDKDKDIGSNLVT